MSIKKARELLSHVKWKHLMGHKTSVRKGAYKFKGHIGKHYGRPALWITSHGRIVFMLFTQGEVTFNWIDWKLSGNWLHPTTFQQVTGLSVEDKVVKNIP